MSEKDDKGCHCGKDGHALNSVNCPVHGAECRPCWTIDGFRECPEYTELHAERSRLRSENAAFREIITWVDCWVSNPASSYSIMALDGLFGMTRDKIAAITIG